MRKAQIVLIEDNPADVYLVELAIREKNIPCALIRFESGVDAVAAFDAAESSQDLHPDAVLLDLNTPRTDGFEALRKLKNSPRLAHVPIAIFTSSRARTDKQRAAIQGARYIEKPSQLNEFLTSVGGAIEEMLASSRR